MSSSLQRNRILRFLTISLGIVTVGVIAWGANQDAENLSARVRSTTLRQQSNEVPIVHITDDRVIEGYSAPASTHVIFRIPDGVRISRNIFFGPEFDLVRYWGYCFDGQENARKARGLRGMDIYNETRFFYSLAERRAQSNRPQPRNEDLIGILDSLHGAAPEEPDSYYNVFRGGESCYVMSSVELPLGLDQDNDLLNNALERAHKTDPNNPDTDGDGIKDGAELYTTKTDPTQPDTDLDGLTDLCEDKDQDGYLDAGETSPTFWDTDRDDLCDGAGRGCRGTSFETACTYANGQRTCNLVPSSPVWTELGQNYGSPSCPGASDYFTDPNNPFTYNIADWDYQWNAFVGGTVGSPKPALPIPSLPGNNLE